MYHPSRRCTTLPGDVPPFQEMHHPSSRCTTHPEVANRLSTESRVCVNYWERIKTWAEGVTYGIVGAEHKNGAALDEIAADRKNAQALGSPWA